MLQHVGRNWNRNQFIHNVYVTIFTWLKRTGYIVGITLFLFYYQAADVIFLTAK